MARMKHSVVVRQTLTGSYDGMLEDDSLEPRPDYWNSVLWKMVMVSWVYVVAIETAHAGTLLLYAHASTWDASAGFSMLAINLDQQSDALLELPQQSGRIIQYTR